MTTTTTIRKPRVKSEQPAPYADTATAKPKRTRRAPKAAPQAPAPTPEDAIIAQALMILESRMREPGATMTDPHEASKFARLKLAGEEREHFGVMFLDTRHRLIAWEVLFTGTIDGAEVHPRIVAQRALALNAAAVILAHNHPSGEAEPSAADRAVTARLKQTLSLLDVRLLDHFVVTATAATSLASRGWV